MDVRDIDAPLHRQSYRPAIIAYNQIALRVRYAELIYTIPDCLRRAAPTLFLPSTAVLHWTCGGHSRCPIQNKEVLKLLKLCVMLHSCKPCESAKDLNNNPNWDSCTRLIYNKLLDEEQVLNNETQDKIPTQEYFVPGEKGVSQNGSSPNIPETCLTCTSARCDLDTCNDVDCNYYTMWNIT